MKDFLACTELVTLVHHVKTADSDSYVCYPIHGVSWYAKTETAVAADGAKAVNVYKVRIPEAVLPSCLPEKLDYLVKGEISGVLKPADLKGSTYFQITAVADNRRGTLPHVAVSGV